MSLGYDRPLYILAFDHRTSFQTKLFGIEGAPTPDDRDRMAEAKRIILDGLLAVAESAPSGAVGALVDEEHGASAAHRAKEQGLLLAMSAEKSSQPEFELEFGDDFAAQIEAFEPDFVKVLVRYNPEGDRAMNRRQAARLAALSDWLAPRPTKLLFELLVPPEPAQLAALESGPDGFAAELRPRLAATAIAELQHAGVEPDIWKVEGLDTAADYRVVSDAARAGGRDDVACVVLGAGADEDTVAHWLREAAGVDGFVGFAIGRTIFWGPLTAWLAGTMDREAAVEAIAGNYRRTIELYAGAAQAV
jgi:myo-inositol catabolism protein IolC